LYNDLYEAWKRERENPEVQPLPKDFCKKLAEYMSKTRKESRMLDGKTIRAKLLMHETKNAQKMVKELLSLRREKTVRKTLAGETLPVESLTGEEEKLAKEVSPSLESFHTLLRDILGGRTPQVGTRGKPKKRVLRFIKDIPAIIGADMKTYGPFKPEDVASVPHENARILVKQGVAVEVEVNLQSS
jgi:DNA replication factor GINS